MFLVTGEVLSLRINFTVLEYIPRDDAGNNIPLDDLGHHMCLRGCVFINHVCRVGKVSCMCHARVQHLSRNLISTTKINNLTNS